MGQVFTDNDISASTLSKKPRPAYDDMLARAESGEFGVIVAYSNSRLTRRPAEWIRLINLANSGKVKIATIASGQQALTTADGRAVALTIAAWDAAEAERTGERVTRAAQQRAERGLPKRGRYRTFGYTDDFSTIVESEAVEIRDAFNRVIVGESLQSIASDWQARGVSMGNGKKVHHSTVRNVVTRALYAGLSTFKGEVVGTATVDPIVTESVYEAAQKALGDNSRPGTNARRYLLSGFVVCGLCFTGMGGSPGSTDKYGHRYPAYHCKKVLNGCGRCSVLAWRVQALALSLVRQRLVRQELSAEPIATEDFQSKIDSVDAEIQGVRDAQAAGDITTLDAIALIKPLNVRRRDYVNKQAKEVIDDERSAFASWEEFQTASLSQQKAIVGSVIETIIVRKAESTQWDPSRLTFVMKRSGHEIRGDKISMVGTMEHLAKSMA